jgi:hypothetical protein
MAHPSILSRIRMARGSVEGYEIVRVWNARDPSRSITLLSPPPGFARPAAHETIFFQKAVHVSQPAPLKLKIRYEALALSHHGTNQRKHGWGIEQVTLPSRVDAAKLGACGSNKMPSRPRAWFIARGTGAGTAATARVPAGRSPAGRRPSCCHRARTSYGQNIDRGRARFLTVINHQDRRDWTPVLWF